MKTSVVIKNLLTGACVYYAIASLLLILINLILRGSLNDVTISVLNVLLLFPFGLCMSAAQMVVKSKAISKILRWLLHYVITITAFLLFLLLPVGIDGGQRAPYYLVGLLMVSLIYWLCFSVIVLTLRRFRSFREE